MEFGEIKNDTVNPLLAATADSYNLFVEYVPGLVGLS